MRRCFRIVPLIILAFALATSLPVGAEAEEKPGDPKLTVERIFSGPEFAAERFGPARWMRDGETYTTLEPSVETKGGRDLVLYRAETGKREVLVPAVKLI
ncbi:MAG: hypothetical protein OEW05_07170, partial [Candidatus Aminicenantes bacterium]|nr:hypothetical protein [Candidatus Aminicenantes bacterium]